MKKELFFEIYECVRDYFEWRDEDELTEFGYIMDRLIYEITDCEFEDVGVELE